MAKIAIISDVHSCMESLEAVLDDISTRGIARIFCLGDVVGYGAEPAVCLDRIRKVTEANILGNHDAMMVAKGFDLRDLDSRIAKPLSLARKEVQAEAQIWIENLPLTLDLGIFEICHASLHEPALFVHISRAQHATSHFARQKKTISFFGHTHIPTILHQDPTGKIRSAKGEAGIRLTAPGKYAIGVGSVSFSRDGDQRASWVEFDPEMMTVVFHRIDYDYDAVATKMRRVLS